VLTYHAKTFELLGLRPRVSPAAVDLLDKVEHRIGRPLPPSLREWYELDGAIDLLLQHSNDDPPVDIADFGKPLRDENGGAAHDLLAHKLLAFRRENQGVCDWAVQLEGSDEPPVVVTFDTQLITWIPCAASFSQHVYACMWDYAASLGRLVSDDLLIMAQNQPLTQEALRFLQSHFQAELVTHGWPGETQYRFFNGDQRILIGADKGQADWFLAAESEEALGQLATLLSPLDGLASTLWSSTKKREVLVQRILGDSRGTG
jgi:hypothetical protein